jgi:hypothetical protein
MLKLSLPSGFEDACGRVRLTLKDDILDHPTTPKMNITQYMYLLLHVCPLLSLPYHHQLHDFLVSAPWRERQDCQIFQRRNLIVQDLPFPWTGRTGYLLGLYTDGLQSGVVTISCHYRCKRSSFCCSSKLCGKLEKAAHHYVECRLGQQMTSGAQRSLCLLCQRSWMALVE